MKKITVLDWTLLKPLKEARGFERTPFKNLLVPKIAIKMEVDVPDEERELVNKDPLLQGVLHDLFKAGVVKFFGIRLFPVLDRIDRGWDQYTKLSQFNLRMQESRNAIKQGLENICDECEKEIWRRAPGQTSKQSQDAQAEVLVKTRHSIVMKAEDCFNLPGGAVPPANPDHFRRKAEQGAQITKVGILAGDGVPLLAGGVPNSQVRGLVKSDAVDMRRSWVKVRQTFHQPRREVLVKEELQSRVTMRWRSRSAA